MLYCADKRNLEGNIISKIIPRNKRIFYDNESDVFFNQDHQVISVKDRVVVPISNELKLPSFYSLLKSKGALFTNKLEDVKKIEQWFAYIETYRQVVPFEPSDLKDLAFLTYLIEVFGLKSEVYITSSNNSTLIDLSSLVDGNLPENCGNNLLISENIDINEDEYGKIEYQVLIERGKLMNLSRLVATDKYIEIPREVFDFIFNFLDSIPKTFPQTFILRIASTKNMYDILDIKPLELADQEVKIKENEQDNTKLNLSKISKV